MKDFVVDITRLTAAVTQRGFGLILILDTSKNHPYTLYNSITDVLEDYGTATKAYEIAARIFGQSPAPQQVAIFGKEYTTGGTVTDLTGALGDLLETEGSWFYLVSTESADAEVTALSNFIEALDKMYFVTSDSLALPGTLENEKTVVMYHDDPEAYVAEGLAALGATAIPGSNTFKFKTVRGVSASDITSTQLAALHTDGGFSYIRKMGVLQTTDGVTTSGEYIDVILGALWIEFRMEEELAQLAVNTPKIPYSNAGIALLASVAESVLKQAVLNGVILEDDDGNGVYEITTVSREDTSSVDIANRVYNGLSWEAVLAGAIHEGIVRGVLTY